MTIEQAVNAYTTFADLANTNVSFKVSYWITKNINLLNDDYMFFIQKRSELYQKYLEEIDGSYLQMVDDTHAQFNVKEGADSNEFATKFNELLRTESAVTPYMIDIQILMNSDLKISSQQLNTIQSFIKEE